MTRPAGSDVKDVQSIASRFINSLQDAMKEAGDDSASGLLARGKIYESASLLFQAIPCYEAASHAGSLEALARLSLCHLKARNLEAGLDAAVKLTAQDRHFQIEFLSTEERISAMTLLGDALLLTGREESAASAYRSSLQANPSDSYTAGRLAHLLLAQGKPEEAAGLERSIGDNPRFRDVRALLSIAAVEPTITPAVRVEQVQRVTQVAMPGRPLRVEGSLRVAAPAADRQWLAAIDVQTDGMTHTERHLAGSAWMEAGRIEHASVAAFARFILQLTACGAPADLVADAARALQDEVEHARLSFGVASAFLGHPVSVGPLDLAGVVATESIEEIVRDTVVEGCVGETLAALQAARGAISAVDPVIRDLLTRISEDEQRHAELAWRFVAWAVQGNPELAAAARAAFDAVEPGEPPARTGAEPLLARCGQPGGVAEWEAARRELSEVIRHRARALLGTGPAGWTPVAASSVLTTMAV